jgi:hypothetical protein
MLGVTCFGLLFTPAFYTFIRRLGREEHGRSHVHVRGDAALEKFAPVMRLAAHPGAGDGHTENPDPKVEVDR